MKSSSMARPDQSTASQVYAQNRDATAYGTGLVMYSLSGPLEDMLHDYILQSILLTQTGNLLYSK